MQKDASLRSGARGFKARQDLSSFEKIVEEAELRTHYDFNDLNPIQQAEETEAAFNTLADLRARAESVSGSSEPVG